MLNKVEQWLVKFQCGKDFNKALLVNTARSMLLPLATVCQEKKETEAPQLFCTLCSSTVNAAVIFCGESQLWLQPIQRSQLVIFIFIQHRGGKGRNVRSY